MKKFSTFLFLALAGSGAYAQIPSLTSSVSGYVWQEAGTPNGTKDSGEKVIQGILVELIDPVTEELVSSTLTDATGKYVLRTNPGTYAVRYTYPTDGYTDQLEPANVTVAAEENKEIAGLGLIPVPQTLTYCTGKVPTVTTWNETFTLPRFDPALGTLGTVRVFSTESVYHQRIGIENKGSADAYNVIVGGRVQMTMPVTGTPFTTQTEVSVEGTLDAYDGVEDYAGLSGVSYFNQYASSTNNRTYSTTTQKAAFTGTGTFSVPTTSQSTTSVVGGGNLGYQVLTDVAAGLCVVYTFTNPLPVRLVSFTAKPADNNVQLAWSTASELNNAYFEVQHSTDTRQFEALGTIQGRGTTNATQQYSFTHKNPDPSTIHYYRLKQVDNDGTYTYSNTRSVEPNGYKGVVLRVASNPVTGAELRALVEYDDTSLEPGATLQLYNLNGKLVGEQRVELKKGINEVRFNTGELPKGMYLLSLRNPALVTIKSVKAVLR